MKNMCIDSKELQLEAHLAEHSRLVSESHTTFTRQHNTIHVMVALAIGIATIISQHLNWFSQLNNFKYIVLVLLPLPFIILGFLHLRDDLKISEIDAYIWFIIRPRIKELTGLQDNQVWDYLKVAELIRYNWKNTFSYVFFVLTLTRYSVPLVTILCSFGLYIWSAIMLPNNEQCNYHWSFVVVFIELMTTVTIFTIGFIILWKGGKYTDEPWFLKNPPSNKK